MHRVDSPPSKGSSLSVQRHSWLRHLSVHSSSILPTGFSLSQLPLGIRLGTPGYTWVHLDGSLVHHKDTFTSNTHLFTSCSPICCTVESVNTSRLLPLLVYLHHLSRPAPPPSITNKSDACISYTEIMNFCLTLGISLFPK